jgi:uncharacterized protein (DUF2235 family)
MSRNIVICIDGTGNDPNDATQPGSDTTNVLRLAEALVQDDRQLVKYFAGVATSGKRLPDVAGRYTGLGAEDLRDKAYAFLGENYRTGDDIFLFGFSRGAAIVRDLANLVDDHGIGDVRSVPVKFLGLWDTVAAFGIPMDVFSLPSQSINIGKKLDIPLNVQHTVHLLAIDEQREPYTPTLIETADNVEEVWFAGGHCDVGGGFQDRELADITLRFMIGRALRQGVRFMESALQEIPVNVLGVGVSHVETQGKMPSRPREIVVHKDHQASTVRPKIHRTVIERKGRQDYDPINVKHLNGNFEVVE